MASRRECPTVYIVSSIWKYEINKCAKVFSLFTWRWQDALTLLIAVARDCRWARGMLHHSTPVKCPRGQLSVSVKEKCNIFVFGEIMDVNQMSKVSLRILHSLSTSYVKDKCQWRTRKPQEHLLFKVCALCHKITASLSLNLIIFSLKHNTNRIHNI